MAILNVYKSSEVKHLATILDTMVTVGIWENIHFYVSKYIWDL